MKTRYALMILALLALPALTQANGQHPSDQFCAQLKLQYGICELPILAALGDDDPQAEPQPGPGRGRGHGDFEQRRKYLEQLRMLKLLEALNLSEDQETKFVADFRTLRRDLRAIERERATVLAELSAAVEKNQVTAATVDQCTAKLKDMDQRRRERGAQFLNDMKQMLSPEQQAKFILFQERFELELLERVREFRGRMGAGDTAPDDSGH